MTTTTKISDQLMPKTYTWKFNQRDSTYSCNVAGGGAEDIKDIMKSEFGIDSCRVDSLSIVPFFVGRDGTSLPNPADSPFKVSISHDDYKQHIAPLRTKEEKMAARYIAAVLRNGSGVNIDSNLIVFSLDGYGAETNNLQVNAPGIDEVYGKLETINQERKLPHCSRLGDNGGIGFAGATIDSIYAMATKPLRIGGVVREGDGIGMGGR